MNIFSYMANGVLKVKTAVLSMALCILAFIIPIHSKAAGLLIADGGFGGVLEIREHTVNVTINNGIAVTDVTQIFSNTENRQVEALYTFPVPKGASVANFSMWINGKEMIGEVIEKKRAREIYNSYKKTRRDPGLLEQVDYKTFEMRIFPINAGAEQKVRLTYYQELNIDNDQGTYVYPLATVTRKGIDTRTTGKFAINAELKSSIPLVHIESPSHPNDFVIARHADSYATASLETPEGSLASDVVINFDISRPKSGIDMITSKEKGEDGYFCMTITAGKELSEKDFGMDFVFVLDVSGSMADSGKMIVSKNALEAFINEVGDKDRMEIMTFNVSPTILFGELKGGSEQARKEAMEFLSNQKARGGTELVPAMTTAYKYNDPDRTLNVVILSDGMTEQGERQTLLRLIQSRPQNARVFCIGIGNEVNRPLLEQMAEDSGGLAAFISRGDNFKRAAKSFKRKLMRPAATDLHLDFEGLQVYDVEPDLLPNLYHGSPIRIYGRYKGNGNVDVQLSGSIQGVALKQNLSIPFPETDSENPEIERMWAWKRIDQLLKKTSRTGRRDQAIDEIIHLGEEYSIVSEYTSFLVLENDAEYRRWKIERKNTARISKDRKAFADRAEKLEAIKKKAISDIGPQAVGKPPVSSQNIRTKPISTPGSQNTTTDRRNNTSRRNQNRDFSPGTGPVGPLFAGLVLWIRRRKIKK